MLCFRSEQVPFDLRITNARKITISWEHFPYFFSDLQNNKYCQGLDVVAWAKAYDVAIFFFFFLS